jgi:hypothetical protein
MKKSLVVLAALVLLGFPPTAWAKGPSQATIAGPGLDRGITLRGDGEMGSGSALGELVDRSGFFPSVFDTSPDPMLKQRPKVELGPRYRVAYVVPGPNGRSTLYQSLYPYAKPYPVSYVAPGQKFWDGQKTHGGWYAATASLKATLVRDGLPRTSPAPSRSAVASTSSIGGPLALAGALALVLAAAAAAFFRVRHRRGLGGV